MATKRTRLDRDNFSIVAEADYIVKKAQTHEGRVVAISGLVLFSTETGDAWMLDPADQLALCLAQDGCRQIYSIQETSSRFQISWEARYRIEGEHFVVVANQGVIRNISGYPVAEITKASGRRHRL